jgi:hypothetical protein
MNFVPEDLEKRLTDFQVAVDGQGTLLGAVAFEMAGNQGRIHHEAFGDFSLADDLRTLLLDRIRMLAQNNTVFRLWTQENAPFWKQAGFNPAERDLLQKLPAKWSNAQAGWSTLALKPEAAIQAITGTSELELLMQEEREKTLRTLEQAKKLKIIATLLAIVFALFIGMVILYAFKKDPTLFQRFSH